MSDLCSRLAAFLNARLDEDEMAALAWLPFGNPGAAQREHIARHDPARVLREVEAGRAIVRRCAGVMDEMDVYPNGLVSPRALLARQVLMWLGVTWADYPDYDGEWKP